MTTIKVTFVRDELPRRFSWLAQHVGYFSGENVAEINRAVGEAIGHAMGPERPTDEEVEAVIRVFRAEFLDYTASIFDVRGIDVSAERSLLDLPGWWPKEW